MSKVRVLVGTRKGAFVLTSDGKRDKWEVSGPSFCGVGDLSHEGIAGGSGANLCVADAGWFGQVMQRSNDGGKTWEPVGNKFAYEGDAGHAPVV